jgi:hypothetical protein
MKRYRFAYLLVTLVLVLFVRPFISTLSVSTAIVDILLFVALIAGAFTSIEQRRQLWTTTVLISLTVVVRVSWHVSEAHSLLVAFLSLAIVSNSCITGFLLKSLFSSEKKSAVTKDTLFKAVSIYLLLGLTWTFAYSLLELLSTGSFTFGTQSLDGSHFERFIGFSLTTLTTLGYGNVSPASPQADSLATLQAIVGQIYLAIVIARLVALQIAQGEKRLHGE